MGTTKQAKLKKLREKYGDNHALYHFEFKGRYGTVGTVPANDLKTAWRRLCNDLDSLGHVWLLNTLTKAKEKKKLKKLIKVSVIPLEKPAIYIPASPP